MPKKYPIQPNLLIDEFREYLKHKNRSANTISAYSYSICLFFSQDLSLSPTDLQVFRNDLLRRYLPSSANQRIHSINQFLRFLEDRYPDHFPEVYQYHLTAVKLPRNSFQDAVISNRDCKKLQRCLRQDGYDFWYFVVRFLVTTGVRVSELVQIKVEHLTCGYLDLYSKGGKIRRIYITDALCSEALVWCKTHHRKSGFLFTVKSGKTITARGIQSRLKQFAHRYGIRPETVYPHSFRHRFAKNFLKRCSDIALLADLLGHESIETTRIYLTRSSIEQRKLLDDMVTW